MLFFDEIGFFFVENENGQENSPVEPIEPYYFKKGPDIQEKITLPRPSRLPFNCHQSCFETEGRKEKSEFGMLTETSILCEKQLKFDYKVNM